MGNPVLIHVTLHQEGVQGDERHPLIHLVIRIGGGCQPGGDGATARLVGHLLDAADGDEVRRAPGHHPHARLNGGPAGSAGCLDRQRLDTAPAREVGDQRPQMLLAA